MKKTNPRKTSSPPAKSKSAAKKAVKSVRKAPKSTASSAKSTAKHAKTKTVPPGYTRHRSGLIVPNTRDQQDSAIVPASKLRRGLRTAREEIDEVVADFVSSTKGDFSVREIELTASFNADGKFLGFGVGGAASITIRIAPDGEE